MTAGTTEGAAPWELPGLLSAIVEQTTDAVFVKDLEGRYLLVNSACARILGRPKEKIVGRSDAQILPPETAERLAEVDRLVTDTGEASSHEEVLPVAGLPRTYFSTKSVYRDAADNALGIIGISVDITERKRVEQELMRSVERLRSSRDQLDAILRGVADGVTAQEPSGRLIYAKLVLRAVERCPILPLGGKQDRLRGSEVPPWHDCTRPGTTPWPW